MAVIPLGLLCQAPSGGDVSVTQGWFIDCKLLLEFYLLSILSLNTVTQAEVGWQGNKGRTAVDMAFANGHNAIGLFLQSRLPSTTAITTTASDGTVLPRLPGLGDDDDDDDDNSDDDKPGSAQRLDDRQDDNGAGRSFEMQEYAPLKKGEAAVIARKIAEDEAHEMMVQEASTLCVPWPFFGIDIR